MSDHLSDQTGATTNAPQVSRRTLIGAAIVGTSAAGLALYSGQTSAKATDVSGWGYADIPAQAGRRVLVTGGNGYPQEDRSGLGYHQALGLARAGADVTIASRNRERGEETVRRIQAEVPGAIVRFEALDLANLASISAFAARMRASGDRLDLLINNAGVMARLKREVSVDGFERVFATNALGPFVLTASLLSLLRNGNEPRVVWMASLRGHSGELNFADLQQTHAYDYPRTYNDSKLANLLTAFECDRRSKASGWGIRSIAAHPGVARTNIVLDGPGPDSTEGWRFKNVRSMWQDPATGALPILYAASSPQAVAGGYYGPTGLMGMRGPPGATEIPSSASNEQVANQLWTTLEQLGKVSFS